MISKTLELHNLGNKVLFSNNLNFDIIKENKFGVLIYINNFSSIGENVFEDFFEDCINKGVSLIYLIGKKSKNIRALCESMIVNTYLKNNENEKYLDIFLIAEDKKSEFESQIFNFLNDSNNDIIKCNYVFTIEKKDFNDVVKLVKKNLDIINS